MSDQVQALLTVVARLDRAGLAYMVSGSTALNFYARPRMTRDIDVVVELAVSDIEPLVRAFSYDFYIDDDMVAAAVTDRGMFNVLHEPTMTKIDFIVRKNEEYRRVEFERRRSVLVGETELFVVAPEDLILSKLLWSQRTRSGQQIDDVRALLAVQGLDSAYLTGWAERLDVAERLSELAG